MSKPRLSRKRTALRFLATMLVVLGVFAFAASYALASVGGDAGGNNDPEECAGYFVGKACKIDVCNANGKTQSIDYNAFLNGSFKVPPCEEDETETETASDPIISVCRNGAVVSIKTSEKLGTDGTVPCPVIDPEISVCRAGAVITILTSAKLATDTTPPCPTVPGNSDAGAAPGAAAGGPVDQGDAPVAGVEYPHDSLAPTSAAKDGPGAGPEYVVAGAADSATTVPGSGTSGAVTPLGGQLPYTGLSTLQVALLGAMLLGVGALCWLVGTPRAKESAAA